MLNLTDVAKWKSLTNLVRKEADIKRVTTALEKVVAATSEITTIAGLIELLDALNFVSPVQRLRFAAQVDKLAERARNELAQRSNTEYNRTVVKIDDWLSRNLPEDIQRNAEDPYGVVRESPELRKLRRICAREVDLDVRDIGDGGTCELGKLIAAVRAPTVQDGARWYWSPGSKCHAYADKAHRAYVGFPRSQIFVNYETSFAAQVDAYLGAVFSEVAGTNPAGGRIAHSFGSNNDRRVDTTYLQFFRKFPEFDWRNRPPVLVGTLKDFKQQLG